MNLSFSAIMSFLHEMPHFLRPPFAGIPNSQGWKRLSQNPVGALDIWNNSPEKLRVPQMNWNSSSAAELPWQLPGPVPQDEAKTKGIA